jgi:hypothetical protein
MEGYYIYTEHKRIKYRANVRMTKIIYRGREYVCGSGVPDLDALFCTRHLGRNSCYPAIQLQSSLNLPDKQRHSVCRLCQSQAASAIPNAILRNHRERGDTYS